jgi:hypothetical protein
MSAAKQLSEIGTAPLGKNDESIMLANPHVERAAEEGWL